MGKRPTSRWAQSLLGLMLVVNSALAVPKAKTSNCLKRTPLTYNGECGDEEVRFEATLQGERLVARLLPGSTSEYAGDLQHLTRLHLNVGGCEVDLAFVAGLFLAVQTDNGFSAKADGLLVMVDESANYTLFSTADGIRRVYKCPSKEVYFDKGDGVRKTAQVVVKLNKKQPSLKIEFVDSKLWTSSSRATSPMSLTIAFMSLLTLLVSANVLRLH